MNRSEKKLWLWIVADDAEVDNDNDNDGDDIDDIDGLDVDDLLQVKCQPATNFLLKTPHWKQVLSSRFHDHSLSVNINWLDEP